MVVGRIGVDIPAQASPTKKSHGKPVVEVELGANTAKGALCVQWRLLNLYVFWLSLGACPSNPDVSPGLTLVASCRLQKIPMTPCFEQLGGLQVRPMDAAILLLARVGHPISTVVVTEL